MNWRDYIVSGPEMLGGKDTIKGTRLSVELVLGWLAQGWTHEMLVKSYPRLTSDDILAVQTFAAEAHRFNTRLESEELK